MVKKGGLPESAARNQGPVIIKKENADKKSWVYVLNP